jgi:hypothetical protein
MPSTGYKSMRWCAWSRPQQEWSKLAWSPSRKKNPTFKVGLRHPMRQYSSANMIVSTRLTMGSPFEFLTSGSSYKSLLSLFSPRRPFSLVPLSGRSWSASLPICPTKPPSIHRARDRPTRSPHGLQELYVRDSAQPTQAAMLVFHQSACRGPSPAAPVQIRSLVASCLLPPNHQLPYCQLVLEDKRRAVLTADLQE